MRRKPTVRVTIELETDVFSRLASKYGNVEWILRQAAIQLAENDSTTIFDVLKYIELNKLLDDIEQTIDKILKSLARYHDHYPEPAKQIINTVLALRIQILYDMLKKIKSMKIAPKYRQLIKELEQKAYEWLKINRELKKLEWKIGADNVDA